MAKFRVIFYLIGILSIQAYGDHRKHKNWPNHVEDLCGESSTDRIIGGENAALGQFPWMARILEYDKGKCFFFPRRFD